MENMSAFGSPDSKIHPPKLQAGTRPAEAPSGQTSPLAISRTPPAASSKLSIQIVYILAMIYGKYERIRQPGFKDTLTQTPGRDPAR